jgi:hypothetical protein
LRAAPTVIVTACVLATFGLLTASNSAEIVISGRLDAANYLSTRAKLLLSSGVRRVAFKGRTGGGYEYGEALAVLIRANNLSTVADSEVSSACFVAFMGGQKRTLSTMRSVSMLVHAPFRAGKRSTDDIVDRYFHLLETHSSGKFPSTYRQMIFDSYSPYTGVVFMSQNTNGMPHQFAMSCVENRSGDDVNCKMLGSVSFDQLGITTGER